MQLIMVHNLDLHNKLLSSSRRPADAIHTSVSLEEMDDMDESVCACCGGADGLIRISDVRCSHADSWATEL
ncbi:hypothetical protein DPMN_103114 [Dreissena polymorpha]|uniref:Uncharacterized protein n=1 Tax=Dreissena polymorpha TaxID=45954 RepID=A0A9D4H7A4_DREPO|nr:hypothetical protein DPMN_103114 [Dreissena polymorpha]